MPPIRDKYTNCRTQSLHKLLVLLHIVIQGINQSYLLLGRNSFSPPFMFPWEAFACNMPFWPLYHQVMSDFSNQQRKLMTVYSTNHNGYLSACRPGLPHGGTWRCPELSMAGGMNPSNPIRVFEQAICTEIKKHNLQMVLSVIKLNLDLYLCVSWLLTLNWF